VVVPAVVDCRATECRACEFKWIRIERARGEKVSADTVDEYSQFARWLGSAYSLDRQAPGVEKGKEKLPRKAT
jgi:hypothetical protein